MSNTLPAAPTLRVSIVEDSIDKAQRLVDEQELLYAHCAVLLRRAQRKLRKAEERHEQRTMAET